GRAWAASGSSVHFPPAAFHFAPKNGSRSVDVGDASTLVVPICVASNRRGDSAPHRGTCHSPGMVVISVTVWMNDIVLLAAATAGFGMNSIRTLTEPTRGTIDHFIVPLSSLHEPMLFMPVTGPPPLGGGWPG